MNGGVGNREGTGMCARLLEKSDVVERREVKVCKAREEGMRCVRECGVEFCCVCTLIDGATLDSSMRSSIEDALRLPPGSNSSLICNSW